MKKQCRSALVTALLGCSMLMCASLAWAGPQPKRVLFVVTSQATMGETAMPTGFYLSEVTHPYEVLVDAGVQVDIVSPEGGKAPVDGFDLDDVVNKAFWEQPDHRAKIENTKKPADVNPQDYGAIYFAGGHGTMWDFPDNPELAKLARTIYEKGGILAAVCHGPAAFIGLKRTDGSVLIKGKALTSFTDDEEREVMKSDMVPFLLETKLRGLGARFQGAPKFQANVVVSDRIVTGQNPASARGVGEKILALLSK